LKRKILCARNVADESRYKHTLKQRRSYFSLDWRVVRRKRFYFILGFCLVIGLILYLRKAGNLQIEAILPLLENYPVLAPMLFICFYAVMVTLLLPTLPMNLAAGFLWGATWGCMFSVIAAALGAACSFFIARQGAHDWLNRKFNFRQWRWLRYQIRRSDWKLLLFTRINPVFPFGPFNYFFGLTSVKFNKFFYMTVLGIFPPSALIAVIGSTLGSLVLDYRSETLLNNVVAMSGLFVFLTGTIIAGKTFTRWQNHKRVLNKRERK
jgi:uncharacterized membrane protein YdjX (TVP38/TMEM64 family)